MLAKVLTDKTSDFGKGGALGGLGRILGVPKIIPDESTELRLLSSKIGVVGTEVVEETDDETDPPWELLLDDRIWMGS